MTEESKAYKYFAFISYSRKDSKAAAWLQKRLEFFRFPVKLVPQDRLPPNPKFVRPVYRDKTNLEFTDEHYWTNIRRALEESRFLIVLCSPASAHQRPDASNHPVNMEVEHFLESHNHQSSHILPIILSGSVTSSGEDAAFCPALRELGAALRDRNLPTMVPDSGATEQDGWEQGFVGTISYLLQLNRETVGTHIQNETRKEAQALRRWLIAVTILTLLSLLLGGLAWENEKEAKENLQLALKNEKTAKANEERALYEERKAKEEAARADKNAKVADEEKSKAVKLNMEASDSSVVRSREAFTNGDTGRGFAYLSEAIRLYPENVKAKRDAVLNMLLRSAPAPLPLLPPLHHEAPVLDAKFSHDGSKVITASEDCFAQVWDAETGEPIGPRLKHQQKVTWAEFSPDDRSVVTASWDRTAQIWETQTGKPIGSALKHEGIVQKACFSPDGRIVATAGGDKMIKLWNASDGTQIGDDLLMDDNPCSLSFSPDSTRLAAGTRTVGSVFLWDTASAKPLKSTLSCRYGPAYTSFSPNQSKLAIVSGDGDIHVIDAKATKLPSKPFYSFGSGFPLEPSWSPDGNVISLTWGQDGSGFQIAFLNTRNEKEQLMLRDKINEVVFTPPSFSPDSLRAILSLSDGSTKVYSLIRNAVNHLKSRRHTERIWKSSFSPDGARIVTASADGTACIWSSGSEEPITIALRHKSSLRDLDWHPLGDSLLTVEENSNVWLWPLKASKELGRYFGDTPLRSVHYSPDGGSILYTSFKSNSSWLVAEQFPKSPPVRTHLGRGFSPNSLYAIHPSPENCALVREVSSKRTIYQGPKHNGRVTDACFSHDGRFAMSSDENGEVKIWDATTGKTFGGTISHGDFVFSCSFSPNSRLCLTVGMDREAKIWDVSSQELRHTFMKGPFPSRRAYFSNDSSRILVSGGNTAQVWTTDTFEARGVELVHELEVVSGCFNPTDDLLVTTSTDKTARLWDAASGLQVGPVLSHDGAVLDAAFTSDGTMLATCGKDGVAKLWPLWSDMNDIDLSTLLKVWAGLEVSSSGLTLLDATWRCQKRKEIKVLNEKSKMHSKFVSWTLTPYKDRSLYPESRRTAEEQVSEDLDYVMTSNESSVDLQEAIRKLSMYLGEKDATRLEQIVSDAYLSCPQHPHIHLALLKLNMTDLSEQELLSIASQNIEMRDSHGIPVQFGGTQGQNRARAVAYLRLLGKEAEAQNMLKELILRFDPERRNWGNPDWCSKCSFWSRGTAREYLEALRMLNQPQGE